MPVSETPDQIFEKAYNALARDLAPEGALERMFAAKFARTTVLLERAQFQIFQLNPFDAETKKEFRQLNSLIASYERAQKFAYTELRRLQAQRTMEKPEADLKTAPRLARVAILTTPAGSLNRHRPAANPTVAPVGQPETPPAAALARAAA